MQKEADLVLTNAHIWTGEPTASYAKALAVTGDRISAMGVEADVRPYIGRKTIVLDLAGKLVLPGFIDNHTHLLLGGFQLLSIDLQAIGGREEFVRAVAAQAAVTAPGCWIAGGGWNQEQWSQPQLPAKEWLDGFTPQTPVFLSRTDWHMALANSAALARAGITRETADPAGGVIERDPVSGEPTGILKDKAVEMVWRSIPAPAAAEYDRALAMAMQHAAQRGVTSVQDITAGNGWQDWEAFERCRAAHKLTLRIYARTPLTEWQQQQTLLAEGFRADRWLRLGGVKGFVDGSLGAATALMCEPYTDLPGSSGLLAEQMLPEGIMKERIAAADQAGLPVSVHAIGDRANHLLLDIFEEVIAANGPRDRRFRIEHAQHLLSADMERMARLGIAASVQPSHIMEDGCWVERRIGRKRCQLAYAFHSLLAAGVAVSFGTDWPVVSLNPLVGIGAAVTRRTRDGNHPGGWIPGQKLTVTQAVEAYTAGSAFAEFSETIKGTLAVAKLADMVVVSQDLFHIDPELIAETEVVYTIVGGNIVYHRD